MTTFKLPDLGEGLAEAEIVAWHVAVGQRIRVDEPMVSVETAKAVVELPAPFAGVVAALHAAAGDLVATGGPLIEITEDGASAVEAGTVVGHMPTSDEELVEPESLVREPRPSTGMSRGRALPVARAAAKRLGIDLAAIVGSGPGGVVTLEDVLQRAQPRAAGPATAPGGTAHEVTAHGLTAHAAAEFGAAATALRGARRAMSQTMSRARDAVALSTVCDDADIEAWSVRGGYMARLMRAIAVACREEPALNAWYDALYNSRVLRDVVDLGVAVDTADGLIVPVLRDIANKTPAELGAALAAHKSAARERRTSAHDLRDATISLSNFGTLAGRYAIPQVVPPAVAILGAGKVRRDAVVAGESIAAHWRLPLSLSFDHRCVTGGEACRFLAAVIADLEKPD
jgi:pyruvate dehydrogenase E2 component (dihydrolipoamide acetyltransferase)